jgi:hypothetical protein
MYDIQFFKEKNAFEINTKNIFIPKTWNVRLETNVYFRMMFFYQVSDLSQVLSQKNATKNSKLRNELNSVNSVDSIFLFTFVSIYETFSTLGYVNHDHRFTEIDFRWITNFFSRKKCAILVSLILVRSLFYIKDF